MKVWIVSVGIDYEGESPVAVYDSLEKAKAKAKELEKERKAKTFAAHDYEDYQEYEVQ